MRRPALVPDTLARPAGDLAERLREALDAALFPVLAGGACAAVAALILVSPRTALAGLIILVVVGLWAIRPELGLAALWSTWLLIAGARRVLDTILESGQYDPLSLVPFAATATVGALMALGRPLPKRLGTVMLLALAGIAVGVLSGARQPTALTFALLAYGSGVLAAAIGYIEGRREHRLDTASRSLVIFLAPLSLYGIVQYVLPLSPWDELWVQQAGLISIIAPGDEDRVRVFSVLNSPATFAGVVSVGLVVALARDRLPPAVLLAIACGLVALGLTYVRMALPALAVALLVYAAASRWRAAPRLMTFTGVVVAVALALGATTHVGGLVLERVSTLGELGEDVSANERQATVWQVVPDAMLAPIGHGLGSAGEPSKLAREQAFLAAVDNGYLGLLWQVGPFGFCLVVLAVATALGALARSRPPPGPLRERRQLVLGVLAVLLVLAAATDVFYGVLGALLWFYLGQALAIAESAPRSDGVAGPPMPVRPLR